MSYIPLTGNHNVWSLRTFTARHMQCIAQCMLWLNICRFVRYKHAAIATGFRFWFEFNRIVARRLKFKKIIANRAKRIKLKYNRQQDNATQSCSCKEISSRWLLTERYEFSFSSRGNSSCCESCFDCYWWKFLTQYEYILKRSHIKQFSNIL